MSILTEDDLTTTPAGQDHPQPARAWWHGWAGPADELVADDVSCWIIAVDRSPTDEPPEPVLHFPVRGGTAALPWRASWDHPPTEADMDSLRRLDED